MVIPLMMEPATEESLQQWNPEVDARLRMQTEPGKPVLPQELIAKMERNMGYRFVGPSKHSAVKVCTWTKNSLCGEGACYKQQFYGIESHRCMEMTPSVPFCTESCQFCWRLRELSAPKWFGAVDPPDIIIEECIKARRQLLQGFAGNPDVERGKIHQSERPTQVAISLDGEPMLYPRINELVEEVLSRKMTAFLVTNGTLPDKVKNLNPEPTNLYITLAGPDKEIFVKTVKPLMKNTWELLMQSLAEIKHKSCATVIRLTLVKGLNMVNPEEYAEIIDRTESKFVELKSFMSVGAARERLPYNTMPLHEELRAFAEEVERKSSYHISDENSRSRVVLMTR
ncbi:MAG: 4-demethylwyosine synthase TYW1 [Candidatus Aenigmarchaeota archaeon]|nr:4-demethylwyosine synthase TYW1 [Candidatus Aenigmarchaeota archaeon]